MVSVAQLLSVTDTDPMAILLDASSCLASRALLLVKLRCSLLQPLYRYYSTAGHVCTGSVLADVPAVQGCTYSLCSY
jgi:hypothetical protein